VTIPIILLALCAAALLAFFAGMARARAVANGVATATGKKMHSRLGYYGTYVGIWTVLPCLAVMIAWVVLDGPVIRQLTADQLPQQIKDMSGPQRTLVTGRIDAVASGLPRLDHDSIDIVRRARYGFATLAEAQRVLQENQVVLGSAPEQYVIAAGYDLMVYQRWSRWLMTGVLGILALGGLGYGILAVRPRLRARNTVERVMMGGLILASTVAIMTTFGIVLSVLFETIHFFQLASPRDFFFGTVWDPRFAAADNAEASGQFGLLPLLWGTLFISGVALSVAVPVGLFAAIYLAEYAGTRFRSFAKPVLEILAGIPTIVYGFFALITFGPFLRDAGATVGLNISATSVLVAGIVMGVMIIPFVSSLSDDIISAVPHSLREGSLGLGATKSETIKRVVLPAALSGIVGAVLLAASRAIGETMIVVLAAGIAANLTINPFEPVTTMTVKIVSQLTGDLEFTSPQTLVAFALGLTLFVVTLGLNIYALYIVRKYREQYD
jgi:phosphate transport system permease protein